MKKILLLCDFIIISYFAHNLCCPIYFCSVLASLNLPAALEDTNGVTVPPSLLEKSEAVRHEGGVDKIDTMIRDLPDLLKCNQEILDAVGYFMLKIEYFETIITSI